MMLFVYAAALVLLGQNATAIMIDPSLGGKPVRENLRGVQNVLHRGQDVTKTGSIWRSTLKFQNAIGACTGVFVEADTMLASAHCFREKQVDREPMSLIFYEGADAIEKKLVSGTDFRVNRHESYHDSYKTQPGGSDFDIAVVTFKNRQILPLTHRKATMLSARYSSALSYGGMAVIAGAGRDIRAPGKKLQFAVGTLVEPNGASLIIELTEGAGACRGDSGGPVFLPTEGGYRLAGLISQTPGSAEMAGECGFIVHATLISADHFKWAMGKARAARALFLSQKSN